MLIGSHYCLPFFSLFGFPVYFFIVSVYALHFYQIELKTAPADFRFPTTNQTRHCFARYIEYHRYVCWKTLHVTCSKKKTLHVNNIPVLQYLNFHATRCVNDKGDETADCEKFAKYYRSLCPGEWVSACAVFCSTTAIYLFIYLFSS
jgi:cytochrome c oxidase subunit 6b